MTLFTEVCSTRCFFRYVCKDLGIRAKTQVLYYPVLPECCKLIAILFSLL